MLLDELMPEYEFSERHRVSIEAPAGRALEAAKQATPGEMPLVRLLFRVRSLPAILSRGGGLPTGSSEPLLAQMMDSGFVFLGEEPDREVILGVIGQMFKLRGDAPAIRNAREFVAFEEPGYAKAAMNFYVEPVVDDGTELFTETRVLTTDPASHRRFGWYWRVIYPGSALVRRSWLYAAKRQAERRSPGLRSYF